VSADVSIVIPTRDRLALLEQTLETVLGQGTVVVVDDASSDGTAELLRDLPVTAVRNDGQAWGPARARNAGIAATETELVAFVDSDDLLLPGAIQKLVAALEAHPGAPFAYGCALSAARTERGWVPDGLIAPRRGRAGELYARNPVPSSGALVRRDALREIRGFDERLFHTEDHDLWLRLARLGPPAHTPELVAVHRRHGGNRRDLSLALGDDVTITGHADVVPALQAARPERLGALLCEHAIEATRAGRPAALVRAFAKLWASQPHRGRILVAAARHWRLRRAAASAGRRAFGEQPALRTWLEAVGQPPAHRA